MVARPRSPPSRAGAGHQPAAALVPVHPGLLWDGSSPGPFHQAAKHPSNCSGKGPGKPGKETRAPWRIPHALAGRQTGTSGRARGRTQNQPGSLKPKAFPELDSVKEVLWPTLTTSQAAHCSRRSPQQSNPPARRPHARSPPNAAHPHGVRGRRRRNPGPAPPRTKTQTLLERHLRVNLFAFHIKKDRRKDSQLRSQHEV